MSKDLNRAQIVDENFRQCVIAQRFPAAKSPTQPADVGLDKAAFLELFDSQIVSRHLDLIARILRERNEGFYTIGSSGHEGNAAIAKVFKTDDMAFLHYRSGAFFIQRAKAEAWNDVIYDQVLSLVASREDPISGGRHKVFGSKSLWIPPQTSTIASHLPKALGTALGITLAKTLKWQGKLSEHSIVLCSFGDASVNHSTAQGAFNAASWIRDAKLPLPLVWICEDNGMGISVATAKEWIQESMGRRIHLHYLYCDGCNLADVYQTALQAKHLARTGQVAFLHMQTVRLLGHAGSDIEFHYRTLGDIERAEQEDPLLHSARTIIEQQWLTVEEILSHYENVRKTVATAAEKAITCAKLNDAKTIMAPIVPPPSEQPIPPVPTLEARQTIFAKQWEQGTQPRTMAQCLNMALTDILLQYPNAMVFGEDVGKKGGVYRITADLLARFGPARVFDTLLDEQTILGTAIGLAHNGFLPIPEIQFLAYLHNAIDQIRGEAATLSFFSQGQFTNPMVIRVPGLAYQKGFGGHFHNENAIAALREIPGIVIACPSQAAEAALLLRTCIQLAHQEQRVVIFLEPIALYMQKDLHLPGDNLALAEYPDPIQSLPFQEVGVAGEEESDTVIITYGNGMHLSRQASHILQQQHQLPVKIVDLRWLAPLPLESLRKEIIDKKKILIVDECRRTGSLSEALITWLEEERIGESVHRITAEDSFIPLGKAAEAVLPKKQDIIDRIVAMSQQG